MEIETFLLERNQTLYENLVEFNLTESGVHPNSIRDLMSPEEIESLIGAPLGYGYTDGSPGLRHNIADWYPGARSSNVAVVHGASEANLLATLSLLSPGDEILFLLPNFMQISGLARAFGINVRNLALKQENDWQPDLSELEEALTERTKMIAFANPGNPTGQVFTAASMEGLVRIAEQRGLYLLSDEIYRGAEIDRPETPTFYGMYERVIVTSSLSKSFALPGLRLGWMMGPEAVVDEVMRRQDYTSIGTGTLSQLIAEKVMSPLTREAVLARSRSILSENVAILDRWARASSAFTFRRPQAGGVAFLRYDLPMSSTAFSERLREEESVFVVAGEWFGIDGHIRIGTGGERSHLEEALKRVDRFVARHSGANKVGSVGPRDGCERNE